MKFKIILLAILASVQTLIAQQLVIDNQGHSGLVHGLSFLEGGKYLLSVSEDKTVRVWDVASGSLHKTYRFEQDNGPNGKIYASAVSRDGRYVFLGGFFDAQGSSGTSIGQIRVLDLVGDRLLPEAGGHANIVTDLVCSKKGDRLISTSADKTIKVWDISGARLQLITTITCESFLNTIAVNDKGTLIVGGDSDGFIRTWNITDPANVIADRAKVHSEGVRKVIYTNSGENIFSSGDDGKVIKWTKNGKFMGFVQNLKGVIGALEVSNDDKYLTAMGRSGVVIDIASSTVISSFDAHTNSVSAIATAPFESFDKVPGNYIASGGGDDKNIIIWELKSGKIVRNLVGSGRSVFAVGANKLDNKIALGQNNPTGDLNDSKLEKAFDLDQLLLKLGEVGQKDYNRNKVSGNGKMLTKESANSVSIGGTMIYTDDKEDGTVRSYSYVQDDQAVVVGSSYSLKKFNTEGDFLGSYKGHLGEVWAISELIGNDLMLSGSSDQTLKIWNVKTGENLLSLFISTDNEWVIWTPQGFYEASAGGEKYIGWHINKGQNKLAEFHDVSAFSDHFHRRDVIEKILSLKSFKEVAAAMSLSEKPQEKIIAAEISWVTPAETTTIVKGIAMDVKLKVKSKTPITVIKLLADGRPIVNETGLNLSGNNQPDDVEITIDVPAGTNRTYSFQLYVEDKDSKIISSERIIQFVNPAVVQEITQNVGDFQESNIPVKQTNSNSTKTMEGASDRSRLKLDPVDDEQPGPSNLYVVSIGVSKFKNSEYNLNFAEADADAISDMFKNQKGKMYNSVKSIKLTNEKATREKILSTFQQLEKYTTIDDMVIIFMASHGMNINNQFYMLPYDGDGNNARVTCVDWRDFSDMIGNMPAKVLLFIDTCHSGALGNSVQNKQQDNTEAVRELSSKEYGVVIMAAATGYEYSLEHPDWGHGAFTLSLIEGIGQGKADVNPDGVIYLRELDYYMAERVRELTGGRQHPTTQKPSSISRLQIAKTQ